MLSSSEFQIQAKFWVLYSSGESHLLLNLLDERHGQKYTHTLYMEIQTHTERERDERLSACDSPFLSLMCWWNEGLMYNRCAIHTQGLLITFQLISNELGWTPFKLTKCVCFLCCSFSLGNEEKKRALGMKEARNRYGIKRNLVNQKNNHIKPSQINEHDSQDDVKPSHLWIIPQCT